MANNGDSTVIYISLGDRAIHYYSSSGNRIVHDVRNFKSVPFDKEFYEDFTAVLTEFGRKYSSASAANTTIVLPDNAVFTDTLTFPAMKKPALKSALNVAVTASYKNKSSLKIKTTPAASSKQFVSYSLVGVRSGIISSLKTACTNAHFLAQNFTFAANATINGLESLNSKTKSGTFLFMDIKHSFTRFVYVLKGRAVASQTISFGFDILDEKKIAAEDLLMHHPVAELAVLNAREKAKAKELTMMGNQNDSAVQAGNENPDEENAFAGADLLTGTHTVSYAKVLPKKVARKLPKFMQREAPEPGEDTVLENFRLFVKWALCFVEGNSKLASLGAPSSVMVNLPGEYAFLMDKVNADEAENGIKFISAGLEKRRNEITQNLEMYGGFFSRKMHTENNF